MNTRSEIEGLKREIERLEGENKNLRLMAHNYPGKMARP